MKSPLKILNSGIKSVNFAKLHKKCHTQNQLKESKNHKIIYNKRAFDSFEEVKSGFLILIWENNKRFNFADYCLIPLRINEKLEWFMLMIWWHQFSLLYLWEIFGRKNNFFWEFYNCTNFSLINRQPPQNNKAPFSNFWCFLAIIFTIQSRNTIKTNNNTPLKFAKY